MMNTTRKLGNAAAALLLWAGSSAAQDLALPSGAILTRDFTKSKGAYDLPTGAWSSDDGLPTKRVEGVISTQSWRIDASGLTPLQVIGPVRDQLSVAGYEIILDCTARDCGGFDFRFATLVLPAPDMFVDLTDFHAVSALAPNGAAVSLLASRDSTAAYLQIIRAGGSVARSQVKTTAPPLVSGATSGLTKLLEDQGHAVLDDLVFQTGSSSLGNGSVSSLDEIAEYLKANPSRRILFVGHTDAVGSLEGNQALSKKRAAAAVAYLRDRRDIPSSQIGADGVGYLSPVASNLTAEGREANRRVEAVLISTE